MYARSVRLGNVRYIKYRGDVDSKSFQDVVKADPYPGYGYQGSHSILKLKIEEIRGEIL